MSRRRIDPIWLRGLAALVAGTPLAIGIAYVLATSVDRGPHTGFSPSTRSAGAAVPPQTLTVPAPSATLAPSRPAPGAPVTPRTAQDVSEPLRRSAVTVATTPSARPAPSTTTRAASTPPATLPPPSSGGDPATDPDPDGDPPDPGLDPDPDPEPDPEPDPDHAVTVPNPFPPDPAA